MLNEFEAQGKVVLVLSPFLTEALGLVITVRVLHNFIPLFIVLV